MTARELWENIHRGRRAKCPISDRQRSYLIDLAKKEGIFDVHFTVINFNDGLRVQIKPERYLVGGYGGTIGKKCTGRFYAEETYHIRFTDTGHETIVKDFDIDRLKREGYTFEFITKK